MALETINYEAQEKQVSWIGISLSEGSELDEFITNDVSSRLNDEEERKEFEADLRALATTGFANNNCEAILSAEVPEERDWAIGEALAEAYLSPRHNITWPWNMARDKRTPKASLPGADLVGFKVSDDDVQLVLGEVKSSSHEGTPPGVMSGRTGMEHQLDKLASDLSLLNQLLKWLHPRCKGNEHETSFKTALTLLLNSGNRAVSLFGVLIRDTKPNELDLEARGKSLAGHLQHPSTCRLVALYLPCAISDLPTRVLKVPSA